MRIVPALIVTFLLLGGMSHGDEPKPDESAADKFFERLDTDGDGKLTLEEAPEQGKMLVRSDQNGDGKISKEEFRGPAFGFNRLDKNGNGFIEADELGDLHQRRLNDPKSMKERLESGDVPKPPQDKKPKGLGDPETKKG